MSNRKQFNKEWLHNIISGKADLDDSLCSDMEDLDAYIGGYADCDVVMEIENGIAQPESEDANSISGISYSLDAIGRRLAFNTVTGAMIAMRSHSKYLPPCEDIARETKGTVTKEDLNPMPFHDIPQDLGEVRNIYQDGLYQLVFTFDKETIRERFAFENEDYHILVASDHQSFEEETCEWEVYFDDIPPGDYRLYVLDAEKKIELFSLRLPQGEK